MDIRSLLGIELPVIQAPMAGVQDSRLAIAVAEAGGLGSLPAATLDAAGLAREVAAFRAATARPLNTNFFCHVPPVADTAHEARWRQALAACYAEAGLDPSSVPAGAGRRPFDQQSAEVLEAFRPEVVSFHFGLPSPELLARVRSWGTRVISTATTVAEGLWLESQGVDAVIAQGLEAGGHRGHFLWHDEDARDIDGPQTETAAAPTRALSGQLGSLALVPQLVRALSVPVIAAGGIATGEGVAAAQALGAAGVQVGTAYLLCPEATTGTLHRAALRHAIDSGEARTELTRLFTGRPARGLVNRLMRELGPLNEAAPAFPLATAALAPLRAWAEAAGRDDYTPLWAGQNLQGCSDTPAGEITRRLAAGWRRDG